MKQTPIRFRSTIRVGAQAVIAAALVATATYAQMAGDPVRGGKLFLQCRACHTVGATDPSGVGPNLYGVFGARAASKPGYTYSPGLAGSGLTWTSDKLDLWIKEPTALVPGTKMAFAGVNDAQSRQDIIAYLATLTAARPSP